MDSFLSLGSILATMPDSAAGDSVTLHEQDDGWWTAVDEATDVASQGETRPGALANLAEALELRRQALETDSDPPEPDAPWFPAGAASG